MTEAARVHQAEERLQTILKAVVVGARAGDPASRPGGEDLTAAFAASGALCPPYDPEALGLLMEHSNSLRQNVDKAKRDALIAKIDAVSDDIGREAFQSLAREITDFFTLADEFGQATLHSVHSISNLALLSSGDNSALGNSVFEVKRRRILELDRRGAYIPICTRQVFLKYYADANAHQIHFWGTQDRESYLAAMLASTSGGIGKYLRLEARDA